MQPSAAMPVSSAPSSYVLWALRAVISAPFHRKIRENNQVMQSRLPEVSFTFWVPTECAPAGCAGPNSTLRKAFPSVICNSTVIQSLDTAKFQLPVHQTHLFNLSTQGLYISISPQPQEGLWELPSPVF